MSNIQRQSSLETNLFGQRDEAADPEAARAIAELAAQLQNESGKSAVVPQQSHLPLKQNVPGSVYTVPASNVQITSQRAPPGNQPRPQPQTFQPGLGTQQPGTRTVIPILDIMKQKYPDKVSQLTSIFDQFNQSKIAQDQLNKAVTTIIGDPKGANELISQGILTGALKMQPKINTPPPPTAGQTVVRGTVVNTPSGGPGLKPGQPNMATVIGTAGLPTGVPVMQGGVQVATVPGRAGPMQPMRGTIVSGQIPPGVNPGMIQGMPTRTVMAMPGQYLPPNNDARAAMLSKTLVPGAPGSGAKVTSLTPEQQRALQGLTPEQKLVLATASPEQKTALIAQVLKKTGGMSAVGVIPGTIPGLGPPPAGMPAVVSGIAGVPSMHGLLPGQVKQPLEPVKKEEEKLEKISNPKELIDVTKLAGVDVKIEAQNILEDDKEAPFPSETSEPTFLSTMPLKKKMTDIAGKVHLSIQEDVYQYITLATQEHMRSILQNLVSIAQKRQDASRDDFPTKITSDMRNKLRQIEIREREEDRKRKLSGSEKDDPSKRARVQTPEEVQRSTTNNTALQAAGNVKIIPKANAVAVGGQTQNPPTFTQQHLQQLQMLTKIHESGKGLSPQQQTMYQQLKVSLARLHQWQQQQQGKVPPPANTSGTLSKRIILKDVQFCQKLIRNHRVVAKPKKKSVQLLM